MINESSIDEMYEPEESIHEQAAQVFANDRPKPLKKGDGKKRKVLERQPLQMGTFTVDKIIYPVKTKRGIKMAPPAP
jgi:hypothetical protein